MKTKLKLIRYENEDIIFERHLIHKISFRVVSNFSVTVGFLAKLDFGNTFLAHQRVAKIGFNCKYFCIQTS